MAKDREIEKKFVIPDENTLERIRTDLWGNSIPGLKVRECVGPLIRYDFYFDTRQRDLFRGGMAFRFGLKSARQARLTFKKPIGRLTRIEIEEAMSPQRAEQALMGFESSRAIAALEREIGRKPLEPKLRVSKFFWAAHGRDWNVVLGYVTYAGRRGALERLDLEVEAEREGTARTVQLVSAILERRYGLLEDPRSKYEFGMRKVG